MEKSEEVFNWLLRRHQKKWDQYHNDDRLKELEYIIYKLESRLEMDFNVSKYMDQVKNKGKTSLEEESDSE